MKTVFHRRLLLVAGASLLLHIVAIDWISQGLGPLDSSPAKPAPAPLVAQLHLAAAQAPVPAKPAAAPAKPAAKPAATPLPETQQAPEPAPGPELPPPVAELEQAVAAPTPPLAPPATPTSEQAGAPLPASDLKSAQPGDAAAGEKPVVLADQPLGPATRRYKVNLPPSADMNLDVRRVNPDGAVWNGIGSITWRLNASGYKVVVEAGVRIIVKVNLIVLTSEGGLDDSGIAPVRATEKRRGRAETATHFDYDARRISFSASERSVPLLSGAQDMATLPLQLAGIARADINQLGGDIDIQVGEDKDAVLFHFVVLGQESLETSLGNLQTWHLVRPPRPGAYNSRLDVWLSPAHQWYPVQIRNTEANGAVTTQTVTHISAAETGK